MNNISRQQLRNISVFQNASSDFITSVIANGQLSKHSKNHVLFVGKDTATRFYIVLDGWMKLYRETIDGTQSIIDVISKNQLCGEGSIFQDNTYPYSAEIVNDAHTLSIPLSLLKKELEANTKFSMDFMSYLAKNKNRNEQELENRTLKNAPQRIGCFVLGLASNKTPGPQTIHLPYDKTLVAAKLGMQPETFSRALKKLKIDIDLEIKGSEIHIPELMDLVNYACSVCSSTFPCNDK